METTGDRVRRGAINGLMAGGVIHLLFWLGALNRGEPLAIIPAVLIVCTAIGAVIGGVKRGPPKQPLS